ncbi:MAG TPA: rod shape-determining protein MreC [Candidatus Limnocylindria bacterium]|jgi:rod shape-determining protein MreC|nr:rod shape-determining protein MreC [Candidatus Limnocylindria bacterium]
MTRAARRQAVAYAILVALSLLLLAFSSSGPLLELRRGVGFALSPMQAVLRDGTRTVGSFFATIGEIEQLRIANQALEQRVQELEVVNRQLETLRGQYEQLAALLEVRSSLDYETVAAEVISRAGSAAERTLSLDRGSDAGIAVDDPVIAGGGALVGQVIEVGPNFSRVLLISDTRSTVVGLTDTSRAEGEIKGQLERPLLMERILATEQLTIGESVVTAGIDLGEGIRSGFPRGLLIGTLVDLQQSPDQLFQTGLVAPGAPLDRLEYVLVIVDFDISQPLPPEPEPSPTP